MSKDEEIKILRDALQMAAGRFEDLADIIERDGSYTNVGFFRASARRCRAALAGQSPQKHVIITRVLDGSSSPAPSP
jgi:hypothetical protein